MKKWMGLLTAIICAFTSSLRADDAQVELIPASPVQAEIPVETLAVTPTTTTDEEAPKQVGKASTDGTNTARSSNAGKYILAATAVAVGITALILVARHDGHK